MLSTVTVISRSPPVRNTITARLFASSRQQGSGCRHIVNNNSFIRKRYYSADLGAHPATTGVGASTIMSKDNKKGTRSNKRSPSKRPTKRLNSKPSQDYNMLETKQQENTSGEEDDWINFDNGPIKSLDGKTFATLEEFIHNFSVKASNSEDRSASALSDNSSTSSGDEVVLTARKPEVSYQQSRQHNAAVAMLDKGIEWFTNKKTIFISLDLEWWEKNSKMLTEVGLAVYDPSPDVQGPGIFKFPNIHYEHFIIKEYQDRLNGRFVSDHKFHCSFVEKSKVITLKECQKAFKQILQHYEQKAALSGMKVVYVGHNLDGDISILKRESFYTGGFEIFDTMKAWQANPTANFSALHKILRYLRIPHGLLHNATNDAHYTLMLALSICDPEYRKWKKLDEPLINSDYALTTKQAVNKTTVNCLSAKQAVRLFYTTHGVDTGV